MALLCIPTALFAASQPAAQTNYLGRSAFPTSIASILQVLGDRIMSPGKERTVFAGTFIDSGGNQASAQLIYQLPAKCRVQIAGAAANTVAFDGEASHSLKAQADSTEEDLLESLSSDSVDGFLDSVRGGAVVHVLGRRFRPAKTTEPYTGPLYDIYELVAPVQTRADRLMRRKWFYFDSNSGTLARVRYTNVTRTGDVAVETRFSGWYVVNGCPLVGQIERRENGKTVFLFRLSSADLQASQDETPFRQVH